MPPFKMENVYGHYDAWLEGPHIPENRPLSRFQRSYVEYCELYGQFLTMARLYNKKDIPVTRIVRDATGALKHEYMIPRFCDVEGGNEIDEAQREMHAKWNKLNKKMDELANHDFVHSVSKLTRIIQTYVDPVTGHTLVDVDVTDTPYLVHHSNVIRQKIVPHPHTTDAYKSKLMAVIQSQ